ncbi:hypothetical protein MPER_06422, partial [Moniliophthora perniciosa FA553]
MRTVPGCPVRGSLLDFVSPPAQQGEKTQLFSRLVKIQEHHAKYPDPVAGGPNLEIEALLEEPNQDGYEEYEEDSISLLFSGEEAYGKYLDLYAHHVAYTNLKNIGKRPGYLQYLDLLIGSLNDPVHQELPKEARFTKDFETMEFEKCWNAGELKEWEDGSDKKEQNSAPSGIWCSACQKHYSKQTVFDAHLTSKKHIKAAEKQAESSAVP